MLTRLLGRASGIDVSRWRQVQPLLASSIIPFNVENSILTSKYSLSVHSSRPNYHKSQNNHEKNQKSEFSMLAIFSVLTSTGFIAYLSSEDKNNLSPIKTAHCAWSRDSDASKFPFLKDEASNRIVYGVDGSTEKQTLSPEDRGDRKSVDKSGLSRTKLSSVVPEPPSTMQELGKVEETELKDEELPLPMYQAKRHLGQPDYMPDEVPYLIIGGGTAGLAAARAIRASDPTSHVLMVSCDTLSANQGPCQRQEYPPYMRPPLSKEIWRRSPKRRLAMLNASGDMRSHSWMFYEPETFYLRPEKLLQATYGGIALWPGQKVVHLDVEKQTAKLDSGHMIKFNQCLLATGGKPRRIQHLEKCRKSGDDLVATGKVSYFRTIDDYKHLQELTTTYASSGGRIAVIGGGFLGSELSASLSRLAKKSGNFSVVQIFKEAGNMSHVLPEYLADHTRTYLEKEGVVMKTQSEVASISKGEDGRLVLKVQQTGEKSQLQDEIVDHVIVALGIEPNTCLSDSLEQDPVLGGYLVNSELEARTGIYVAGDASSYYDPLLGRRRVEHVSHAEESGALAGRNMVAGSRDNAEANLPKASYQHQTSFWSTLGKDLSWDAVGLIDSRNLESHGFFAGSEEDSEIGSYDLPGVVFYTKPGGRVVGVLLWNLPDEFYQDEKHFSPGRLNLARKILQDRRIAASPEELQELVRQFDIFETIDDDYQELKNFMDAKDKELEESAQLEKLDNEKQNQ